jgi:hypothetical protein
MKHEKETKKTIRKVFKKVGKKMPLYCGDEGLWQEEFWTLIADHLTQTQVSYLDEHPEFARECLFDEIQVEELDAQAIAKDLLLNGPDNMTEAKGFCGPFWSYQ